MNYVAKKQKLHIDKDYWTGLTEDGFFTNGYYAVIPSPTDSLPKEMYDKEKITAISTIIPDVDHHQVFFSHIIQDSKWSNKRRKGKEYYDVLVIQDGVNEEDKIYLNREYVDAVLSRFPDASMYASDRFHAVVFKDGMGEMIGLVMPLILD